MRISDWSSDVCSSDLKRFAAAFEARQVVKGYVAVLEGVPAEQSGMIDLPLYKVSSAEEGWRMVVDQRGKAARSEEQTSELQSLMRISYAVFCLKKKKSHCYI